MINRKAIKRNFRILCRIESARHSQPVRQDILNAKYEDSRLVIRLINKQRVGSRHCVSELHVGDRIHNTSSEILEGFREHFQSLATHSDGTSFDKTYSKLV